MIDEKLISMNEALESVIEDMGDQILSDRNNKALKKLQNLLVEKGLTITALVNIKQENLLEKKMESDPDNLPRFHLRRSVKVEEIYI